MMKKIFAAAALLAAVAVMGAYRGHSIELDHADGYYRAGETATCRVTLCEDGKPLSGTRARVIIRWEGKAVERKEFTTTGKPVEFSYKSDKPGWVFFGFQVLDANGKLLSGPGVQKHPQKPAITT